MFVCFLFVFVFVLGFVLVFVILQILPPDKWVGLSLLVRGYFLLNFFALIFLFFGCICICFSIFVILQIRRFDKRVRLSLLVRGNFLLFLCLYTCLYLYLKFFIILPLWQMSQIITARPRLATAHFPPSPFSNSFIQHMFVQSAWPRWNSADTNRNRKTCLNRNTNKNTNSIT